LHISVEPILAGCANFPKLSEQDCSLQKMSRQQNKASDSVEASHAPIDFLGIFYQEKAPPKRG
jgi:hypothetical protein